MRNLISDLFAKALDVAEPWFVKKVDFDAAKTGDDHPYRFHG